MTVKIGTTNSPTALYDALIDFLTTDADLIAGSQGWLKAWIHPDGEHAGVILRGPGLAGDQAIFVGMSLHLDDTAQEHWMELYGMTGVLGTSKTMLGHVNVSPTMVRMFLGSGLETAYWFVASGRRFAVAARMSTVFEACYGGLFLPYATPLRYPYPLMIGGSAGKVWGSSAPDSWRSIYGNHSQFPFAHMDDNQEQTSSLLMLSPAGEWLDCSGTNYAGADVGDVVVHPNQDTILNPYFSADSRDLSDDSPGPGQVRGHARMGAAKDGTTPLTHMHLVRITGQEAVYGVFDGCFRVAGVDNSSENIVTVDDEDYLVVQNTYRTTTGDYWALKLE